MPSKLTPDKIKAIAQSYCTNGRNKSKALIDNGYSESYANCGEREAVYKNIQVIEEIAKIEAELSEKCVWDATESERKLQETYDFAKSCKQPPAMVSAVTALNKLKGFDKDTGTKEAPDALSEADLTTLRAMAKVITDKGLKGPQLAQGESKAEQEQNSGNDVKTA